LSKVGRDWFNVGGGIDPFPTILRHVSGKKRRNGVKKLIENIRRNQKTQYGPAYCDSTPPSMGPMLGARMLDTDV
jgi:hypothetical protein